MMVDDNDVHNDNNIKETKIIPVLNQLHTTP
jgi:hypothetical protein